MHRPPVNDDGHDLRTIRTDCARIELGIGRDRISSDGRSVGPRGSLQRLRRPNCSGNEGDALLPHLVESSFIADRGWRDERAVLGL